MNSYKFSRRNTLSYHVHPPAIFLYDIFDFDILKDIAKTQPGLESAVFDNTYGPKIYTKNIKTFRSVIKYLQYRNVNYNIYGMGYTGISALIKNLPVLVDVKVALRNLGFQVRMYRTFIRIDLKGPRLLSLVYLEKEEKSKQIFNLTSLCGFPIETVSIGTSTRLFDLPIPTCLLSSRSQSNNLKNAFTSGTSEDTSNVFNLDNEEAENSEQRLRESDEEAIDSFVAGFKAGYL